MTLHVPYQQARARIADLEQLVDQLRAALQGEKERADKASFGCGHACQDMY